MKKWIGYTKSGARNVFSYSIETQETKLIKENAFLCGVMNQEYYVISDQYNYIVFDIFDAELYSFRASALRILDKYLCYYLDEEKYLYYYEPSKDIKLSVNMKPFVMEVSSQLISSIDAFDNHIVLFISEESNYVDSEYSPILLLIVFLYTVS